MKKIHFYIFIILFTINKSIGQLVPLEQLKKERGTFTHADTLRGKLSSARDCYDVYFYDLNVEINPKEKTIKGYNKIYFKVNRPFNRMQIDLFSELTIDSVVAQDRRLAFRRDSNACFIDFAQIQKDTGSVCVYYGGKPRTAARAPWDGGFVWSKDKAGNDWVGVACEGLGASVWYPLKDHLSDEPDSMRIALTVPAALQAVSNGTLVNVVSNENGTRTFEWLVNYPINSYNVTVNIANYTHFSDSYPSENGPLQLDYYVLPYNLEKAKTHFQQVKPMLKIFEKYFGPYPFPKDGYALVETPYWGMEHQGAIAYGNNFINNEYSFDFIIIHESGHEWFGNNISAKDHADLWIHESFTTYSEAIYVEALQGKDKAIQYLRKQRERIKNLDPMLGPPDVNFNAFKSSDVYYKGTWMLHTLRHIVNNDSIWFIALRGMYDRFRLSTTNTTEIVNYFSSTLGFDCNPFFSVYLGYTNLPVLEYIIESSASKKHLKYRWKTPVDKFSYPVDIKINAENVRLFPDKNWKSIVIAGGSGEEIIEFPDDLFYIEHLKVEK